MKKLKVEEHIWQIGDIIQEGLFDSKIAAVVSMKLLSESKRTMNKELFSSSIAANTNSKNDGLLLIINKESFT